MNPPPEAIADADVVLHLRVQVTPQVRDAFLSFCRRAFPVYESVGGCRMALYEDSRAPGRFDEVGYYRTESDYARAEAALKDRPEQAELIREWKTLLSGPPDVSIERRTKL
ncbi:MAG: hypothetical protein HY925_00150 [Elusimicrobia bacterium]|nr:hypothetical protein [Elusimicrobiota bacterium]